jgi:tellurite resistance protein TerC
MEFDITWWIGFNAVLILLLIFDISRFAKSEITKREALLTTGFCVLLALGFALFLYMVKGPHIALDFITGYLIEASLSVDNLFVFILIFGFLKVPKKFQYRVLVWGILGALTMRFTFIFAGIALIQKLHWMIYIFGLFLVITGTMMFKKKEREFSPEQNPLVRLFKKFMPVTDSWHDCGTEGKFFVRKAGKLFATPLFVALLTVESTDLIFALDSIPAVFAITLNPFIVYSCNALAILGLRSLFFVLQDLLTYFSLLHYGVCVILMFVGTKMVLSPIVQISSGLSLAIIGAVILTSVLLSIAIKKK